MLVKKCDSRAWRISPRLGRVYFVVKTRLKAATKRKRQKAKKNCVDLCSDQKAPKGQKDAERAKIPYFTEL